MRNASAHKPAKTGSTRAAAGFIAPHAGTLLGFRNVGTLKMHQKVARGFPFSALEQLRKHLGLSMLEVAELVSIKPRTLSRRREAKRLTPEESDRVLRLSRLFGKAISLFDGDMPATRKWFTSPVTALAGAAPREFATTDVGAREVESLIGRLEHGIFS